MGIPLTHPAVQQAIERGLIRAADLADAPTVAAEPPADRNAPALVAASFIPPGTWTLPIVTASEINGRDWRKRSNRTQAARRAVSAAFGPTLEHVSAFAARYHAGGPLRVVLTRIGGRTLDASNLPSALKATEDAVALILGADDGDPRWRCEWHQEPGPAVGVRVELAAL